MIDNYGNNVFLINRLPVPSAVTRNEDGSHSIFIKAQLSWESQIAAYKHELTHIRKQDFNRDDLQAIEHEAHKGM